MSGAEADPWSGLRRFTSARIALGRVGHALPTREVLAFALAHARARDAVHAALDVAAVSADLRALGLEPIAVASDATDRAVYLARPDLGRRLAETSRTELTAVARPADLAIAVADGLSAPAAQRHAVPLLSELGPLLAAAGLSLARPVVATQARVALGEAVAAALGTRAVLVLIGERPGLSAPDSLGAYLTVAPRPGRTTDADRNCLSNVRPEGLSYRLAAARLAWLIREGLRRGLTGVALKDESDGVVLAAAPAGRSIGREQV